MLLEQIQREKNEWVKNGYAGIKPQSKHFLNNLKEVGFLHAPQTEAMETYIFLKEVKGNKPITELLKSYYKDDKDLLLNGLGIPKSKAFDLIGNKNLIDNLIKEKLGNDDYSSNVFSLTMGAGKTLLMGLMIIYDFILAFNYKDDKRFAKNALIFAPDKTIIESLKEIKTFDWFKLIPKEYSDILLNIKYHYLEDNKTELNFIGNYNIIITNSQKIILKTQRKATKDLFSDINYLEKKEIENNRLKAIRELDNLAIFVDEAHHAFGKNLEGGLKKVKQTIDFLNKEINNLIAVVNLTGTPYVNGKMIDETVYLFGLKEGIETGILKQIKIFSYDNVKSNHFIKDTLITFFRNHKKDVENKTPKIAFFAPSIKELQEELKPSIEKCLIELGINTNKIIEYHTEAEQNKEEFLKLDTEESKKQIILLVGKGTEGWNCKSLFAVALYRKPKSPIFILQATTRCLRAIGDNRKKANIFLSSDNYNILDKELKNNFNLNIADIDDKDFELAEHNLKVLKKKKIKVKRIETKIIAIKKVNIENIKIKLNKEEKESVKTISYVELNDNKANYFKTKETMQIKGDINYYEAIELIYRHTHLDYSDIKKILLNNKIKLDNIKAEQIDLIIMQILKKGFEIEEEETETIETIELTKAFPFKITTEKDKNGLIVYKKNKNQRLGFHINIYNFDSLDEKDLFFILSEELEKDEAIKDIYFTGGITNAKHTDFYFEYNNIEKESVSKYYPDFLIETTNKRYLILEVKGRDKKNDYEANKKLYKKGKKEVFNNVFSKELGFKEFNKQNKDFNYKILFNARLQEEQKEILKNIRKFATDKNFIIKQPQKLFKQKTFILSNAK